MQTRLFWKLSIAASLAIILGATAPARADITGLFGTGQDATGKAVSDTPATGLADLHYTLTSAPAGVALGTTFVVQPGNFPIPPWFPDAAAGTQGGGKWISGPDTPPNEFAPNGLYDYHSTFNSTTAGTFTFSGTLTADDQAVVKINGVQVGTTTGDQIYATLFNYSGSAAVVAGVNSVDIIVNNTHNVVQGARLTISAAVPEPSTIVMGLGAAGLLGFVKLTRYRRARA
jgi:hypothetical protein